MAGFDPEAQNIFNGLWEFFNDHPSVNDQRLMDWSVPTDEHYNAGRMPWRIGIDALLNNDTISWEQVRKLSLWAQKVADNDPGKFLAGYKLDGTPLNCSNYFTTFFVAPLGVAAMNLPSQQKWLNDIYEAVYDKVENYYNDTVTLLCLIAMTGTVPR